MNKLFLTAGFIVLTQLLVAQDLTKAKERATQRYEKYNAVLKFTAEQEEIVKNLINGIEHKKENVNADVHFTEAEKKEANLNNEAVLENQLTAILNDSQKAAYQKSFKTKK